jgi:hypothetical protein
MIGGAEGGRSPDLMTARLGGSIPPGITRSAVVVISTV